MMGEMMEKNLVMVMVLTLDSTLVLLSAVHLDKWLVERKVCKMAPRLVPYLALHLAMNLVSYWVRSLVRTRVQQLVDYWVD